MEKKLVDIWSGALGLKKEKIGIDDNFFELGGHSLKGTVVITAIHKEFNVKMSLGEIFKIPRICKIAEYIKDAAEERYIPIEIAEEKEYYELSYAQRRLWILCQFEEESTAYNMPFAYILTGSLQAGVFERALHRLVDRHDSLRTVFISVNGEPKQRILGKMDFNLEQVDLRNMEKEAKEMTGRELFLEGANRVLNLEKGPLFLFKLVRFEENTYLWIFNIHHIVNDGWSQGILNNEIFALYNAFLKNEASPMQHLKLKYRDYTLWHNELIKGDHFRKAETYWLEKFKDKPNGIELPLDHSRKPVQTFNGGRVSFSIDKTITKKLHRLCFVEDATLFMGLLSLLGILLYKYTNQRDIIIGLPIAGRKRQELNDIVGFLVNTLVFRNELNPGKSFKELVKGIKQETLDCYENQDYPFDILIEKLELERDLSQSPLFNVMLAHNNAEILETGLSMEGITLSDYPYFLDFNMSKFDLIFFMDEVDKQISVMLEYNSDLFERGTIERLSKNLVTLLNHIVVEADAPVSELRCMDGAEYKKVVEEFNDRKREFPRLNIQELFEIQVQKTGNKQAVVFAGENITYHALNERVNRFAHYLREVYRVRPNDVIGISMARSVDMIVVLLGIVKSGAAYLALDPTYPRERVLHVLGDSRSDILVIDEMRPQLFADYSGEILNINEHRGKIAQQSKENPQVVNTAADILYVNYTSGSTGTPNGAMLSHDILTNLIQWQKNTTVIDCSLRCLQFTSINFCVSFQEIIGTLTSGGELHLIGDVERQDIDYLMDFLGEHRVEILFLPFSYLNFIFNESSRWDRSFNHNLKHIITAGEQLKITVGLKRFLDLNPHIQLHNHYGSTEMHVVTSYTLDASIADKTPIPPAGKPVSNAAIYILDEHLRPVPIGVWGELCVKGSSSVPGYINNEELNKKKLLHHPELSADSKNLFRSGDIGRWHEDGNIELRGRKDFQVKIRGFRVEPGEIESRVLSIKGVRECVVVVKEDEKKQKYLAAYVVIEDLEVGDIKRILNSMLPLYMIPRLVVLKNLPLMPNGKVDRENLPEPEFAAGQEYIAPRNKVEEKLTRIWAEILSLDKELISIDANFFDLGGHSLKATVFTAQVQKELQVKVPLTEIFKAPTIAEIAAYITKEATMEAYVPLRSTDEREYYPLSSAQKRIYIVQQTKPDTTSYNMPLAFLLYGKLDRGEIAGCFKELVKRHDSFRTSFHLVDDYPVQKIHDPGDVDFQIEYDEQQTNSRDLIHQTQDVFVRPFDLTKTPLLRVRLIKEAEDRFILMTDIHHIIFDGISYTIFFREFKALYNGGELPALKLQYKDFSQWQNSEIQEEARKKHESYWLKEFAGDLPQLKLPLDYNGGESFSYEGDEMFFSIGNERREALLEFAKQEEVTLFMLLLAVFYILLAKMCDQEDIIIGIPTAGREHADLRQIIGMFVNPLPLRNFPKGEKTFRQFLRELKNRALLAYDNQDYQYEDLVERLALNRKSGRSEIFNVMFTLQNLQEKSESYLEIELPGIQSERYGDIVNKVSRFDITFYAFEERDRVDCFFEYSTQIFDEVTMEVMWERYLLLLDNVIRDVECKIENLQYKTAVEEKLSEAAPVEFDF
ncbi:MAG: amino acid adenylation domain-containing protein [Candidatus Aminicenantes bacterium]|nr:amino acid adenylation domain-containing protein [Candidatus Aminicenantes bacterium]